MWQGHAPGGCGEEAVSRPFQLCRHLYSWGRGPSSTSTCTTSRGRWGPSQFPRDPLSCLHLHRDDPGHRPVVRSAASSPTPLCSLGSPLPGTEPAQVAGLGSGCLWGPLSCPPPPPHIASGTAVHLVNGVSWVKVARATRVFLCLRGAPGTRRGSGLRGSRLTAQHAGAPPEATRQSGQARGEAARQPGALSPCGPCAPTTRLRGAGLPVRPWSPRSRAAVRTCPATEPYLSAPPVAPSPAAELTGPSSQVFFNFFLTVVKYIEPTFCHMEPR